MKPEKVSLKKLLAKNTSGKKAAQKKGESRDDNKKDLMAEHSVVSLSSPLTRTEFRPVCITEGKTLGPFTSSEQAAKDKIQQHEADFPDHVTDIEEKA